MLFPSESGPPLARHLFLRGVEINVIDWHTMANDRRYRIVHQKERVCFFDFSPKIWRIIHFFVILQPIINQSVKQISEIKPQNFPPHPTNVLTPLRKRFSE